MKHPRVKKIFTYLLAILFVFVFAAVIAIHDTAKGSTNMQKHNAMKLDAIDRTLDDLSETYDQAQANLRELHEVKAVLSAAAVEDIILKEGDNAIMLYGNGAIVRKENGRLVCPSHLDKRLGISADDLTARKGLLDALGNELMLVAYCRIGSTDYYFLTWDEMADINEDIIGKINALDTIHNTETAYNGYILFVHPEPGNESNAVILYAPEKFSEAATTADLSIDLQALQESDILFNYHKEAYTCSLRKTDDTGLMTLFISPAEDLLLRSLQQSFFLSALVSVLFLAFLVCAFSLYSYVKEYSLPPVLEKRYRPSRVRLFTVLYGLLCAVIVFICGAVVFSLSGLLEASRTGGESLDILEERISLIKEGGTLSSSDNVDIYVEYADLTANLLDVFPELRQSRTLDHLADIIHAASITLYDHNGYETISSSGYLGLVLSTQKGSPGYDFRRLLHGIPSIYHEAAIDEFTGTEQAQIGIRINDPDAPGMYGAMIICVDPEQIDPAISEDINSLMSNMSLENTLYFAADRTTGKITFSGDPDLVGDSILDLGLSMNDLHGDLMKFAKSMRGSYFIVTEEMDDLILFNGVDRSYLNTGMSSSLAVSVIMFLVMFCILALIALFSYNDHYYDTYKVTGSGVTTGENEVLTPSGELKFSVDPSRRWTSLRGLWKDLRPESKGAVVTEILTALYIINSLFSVVNNSAVSQHSLYYYLTTGAWDKGINLFAVAGIVLLGSELLLGMIIIQTVLRILSLLLGTRGETVCRLLINLVRYAAVLSFVYFSLSYLGFDTNALLASVGLLTLAVSLGARDLVADVLAGITIVFEGEFQVGDIIEIGGYRGTVLEIGVRSTKILGQGGNIKVIGNQDVKNVINMTQLNSWYPSEITISSDNSIDELEEMLSRELPGIGKRHPEIVSGPTYKGISAIGKGTITITILTECKEADYHHVQRTVNKELHRLFAGQGIKI